MAEVTYSKMAKRVDGSVRLPIIQRRAVDLNSSELGLAKALASEILGESRNHAELSYFQPQVRQGLGDAPYIFFGDIGEIRLFGHRTSGPIEYRLSVLAGEGDIVVIGGQQNRSFEQYLEKDLGLGHVDYLYTDQADDEIGVPTPVKCLKDAGAYAQLRTKVEERGGATLVAHITTGTVWALAKNLGRDTGLPIHVAGPTPAMTAQANDKLWFAKLATRLFGESAVPRNYSVFGAAALAGRVHSLARNHEKIVVKVPDSAGSAGNFPVLSTDIAGMSVKNLHLYLKDMIADVAGSSPYPMMVQVWERDVLTSPSVQLWIPLAEDGPPVIEGIFEQYLTGQAGRFSGAVPASLPDEWDFRLSRDSMMLGYVLQALGYFGRCSFDTVISGENFGSASLYWVECNGRWGGVSVPMTLLNRLFAPDKTPAYIIAHRSGLVQPPRPFSTGLDILEDVLWHPGTNNGIIFITPIGFEEGSTMIFLSLTNKTTDALHQAETVFQRLALNP
jgi:hypothetical protein